MKCRCAEMPDAYQFPSRFFATVKGLDWQTGQPLVPKTPGLMKRKPYYFLAHLEFVEIDSKDWLLLLRCQECLQFWQLDWTGTPKLSVWAIKLSTVENWPASGLETRLRILVNSRGGTGEAVCKWPRCEEKVLKNSLYCPYHAYGWWERE